MTRLQGALVGAAVLTLLSGCLVVGGVNAINDRTPAAAAAASSTSTSPSGPPSRTVTSTTAPTSVAATSTTASGSTPSASTPPPPALPGGSAWATVDSEQVRFAVPAAWVEINPVALKEAAAVPAQITALAKKLGISTSELLSRFKDVDIAFLAAPVNGYSTNVAVMTEDIASLPDDDWVTQTYAVSGKVKVLGTARPSTLVGPGLRINGTVSLRGVTINLTTLIVDLGRNCVILEVAGRKRADVDRVVSTIVSTLHSI